VVNFCCGTVFGSLQSFTTTEATRFFGGGFVPLLNVFSRFGSAHGEMFRQLFCLAALCAVADAFRTAAPAAVAQPRLRARALVMEVQQEEKKGFFSRFSGDATGKVTPTKAEPEEELSESKKLLQQVKDAGVAGIISYIFWEWAFWGVSVPVCIFGYQAATGHWPDFSDQDDLAKLGAEAFAFVNVARFAVPLRIGLALSTTPWVQENIVDNFKKDEA